ncbi:tip elongation aberrant protein 1-like [Alligator mississippiensis]|uniref:Tip elongation aberrant protein 1-like n=1 Tax=Alligator mississippiensis TaxID=8496 RepID=A0A151M820_ALLMI|nr:tip elongation aberrant protein 1-like [Alligator mississippiensis]
MPFVTVPVDSQLLRSSHYPSTSERNRYNSSKMALASGHWIRKEITGNPPSPRHGHALTVAGDIAFVFGGCSMHNSFDDQPTYFNDFYMLTNPLAWPLPQTYCYLPGPDPTILPLHHTAEGLAIHECTFTIFVISIKKTIVVKGKIYLFGGCSTQEAEECLPGVHSFDLSSLTWQKIKTTGVAPRTLRHSSAVVGENIYVYGGVHYGKTVDDLYMFSTVSLNWTPVKTTGPAPGARSGHAFATVGQLIYMFGGSSSENAYCTDVYALDTGIFAHYR